MSDLEAWKRNPPMTVTDEDNPQTRLMDAFHERTQRCVDVLHLGCAMIEQRHREGNHSECLPVEDGKSGWDDQSLLREPTGYDGSETEVYAFARQQAELRQSVPVQDIRLTRARSAVEQGLPMSPMESEDLLALAIEQQRSIRMLTEENGALKARLAEAIRSVGELAPSPTEALLAAARAVLAAAEPTPACWCGSETHRDAEGVWCYRDINHDVTWRPEAPAERPEGG